MKGIGIVAMILGHSPLPHVFISFIFTWHMPLFFLISGFFFHPLNIKESIKKNFRALLVPYFLTIFIIIFLYFIFGSSHYSSFKDVLGAAIIGAGSRNLPMLQNYFVGAIWFLQALFWCKVFYVVIDTYSTGFLKIISILIVSSISMYLGAFFFVPTNLLQGASALIFFEIGYQFRTSSFLELRLNHLLLVLISLLLIAFSIHSGSMSMVRCFYGFYPINILCAISVFFLLYKLSHLLNSNEIISKCLSFLGKISLLILCIHNIDLFFGVFPLLNNNFFHLTGVEGKFLLVIWRLFLPVFLSYYLVKLRIITELFKIKV